MIEVCIFSHLGKDDKPTGQKSVLIRLHDDKGSLGALLTADDARDVALALCAKADKIDPAN